MSMYLYCILDRASDIPQSTSAAPQPDDGSSRRRESTPPSTCVYFTIAPFLTRFCRKSREPLNSSLTCGKIKIYARFGTEGVKDMGTRFRKSLNLNRCESLFAVCVVSAASAIPSGVCHKSTVISAPRQCSWYWQSAMLKRSKPRQKAASLRQRSATQTP